MGETMSERPFATGFSHVGVCVSDLERAKAFYRDGLGFAEGVASNSRNEVANLLGLAPDIDMITQMMLMDHTVVELIHFDNPAAIPADGLRPMNQMGLTHLSFTVNDVDAAAQHLVKHGATLRPETRTSIPFPNGESCELVFITDPDGTRIEIYQPPAAWSMSG